MLASFCARPVAKGIPVTRLLSCVGVSAPVLNVGRDRKSTRLNSSHLVISYAAFCLKKNRDSDSRWILGSLCALSKTAGRSGCNDSESPSALAAPQCIRVALGAEHELGRAVRQVVSK